MLPFLSVAGNLSTGFPLSSTNVNVSGFIVEVSEPGVNVGFPFWISPCLAVDSASCAVGSTGVICGVYLAVAFVPFSSSPWIVTGRTGPT